MKTELNDLIIRSADAGVALQSEQGFLPKGHSGPRYRMDTYVRTTAHWALTFFKAYELTRDQRFLDAAIRACDYLISENNRPHGFTFRCNERDGAIPACNGLIGQAWAIEPLIVIGSALKDDRYLEVARDILTIIPYDPDSHSWTTVDIDGRVLGEHKTLNQQVWMTAVAIMLGKSTGDGDLAGKGVDFFTHIKEKLVPLEGGLIGQMIRTKQTWAAAKLFVKRVLSRRFLVERSEAYLTFLLYGVALAYEYSCEETFWRDEGLRRVIGGAVGYVEGDYPYGFLEDDDSFRWSYNPTGIEMAYVAQTFRGYLDAIDPMTSERTVKKWLGKQLEGYYDTDAGLLNRNTADPDVLASRLYEATRIKNVEVVF